jgi:hypothetical protein
MEDFKQARQQLEAARQSQLNNYREFLQSREQLKKITKQREAVERKVSDNSDDYIEELNRLREEEKRASAVLARRKEAYTGSKANTGRLYDVFQPVSDPRQQISNLKDDFPFLLFPIRIETRFKKLTVRDRTIDQLWVRIYPDDCLIDSFEELLSQTEVANAVFYWQKWWEAGGDEDLERGAWRTLVSSHGSGRALYILEQYVPVNAVDAPNKVSTDEVILVASAAQLPTTQEKGWLETYWTTVWRVMGDVTKETAAWSGLVSDTGSEAAAEDLSKRFTPFNMTALPSAGKTKDETVVKLAFLQLPDAATITTKEQSWSQAPMVDMLPERFVVTGYIGNSIAFQEMTAHIPSPLYVAPDPGTPAEEQFSKDENGDIVFPEELQWMIDFDTAIQNGLGLKINITGDQAQRGFDRIVVLGVRLSADEDKGQELVETLFDHHRKSRKGLSIIPQGTPTNNTEDDAAGHDSLDNADESFNTLKKGKLFDYQADLSLKTDGQWLAESLGIRYDAVNKLANADQTDIAEGRMMNIALWPATLGYTMDTMMQPVFDDNDIAITRDFFNSFISGRGRVPAIKIGKQPYGILPTVAFSRLGWIKQNDNFGLRINRGRNYLLELYTILKRIDEDWTPLLDKVSYISKGGDAHQILLNALGLTASSIEFYQRTAESKEDLFNRFSLMGLAGNFVTAIVSNWYLTSGTALLKKHGYTGDEIPDILNKFFLKSQNQLKGPLIDDRPLSETEKIRAYTTDNKNYIQWLREAAAAGHDVLRKRQGFTDNKIPTALLYLLLHHSLDLGYVEVSLRLYHKAGLLNDQQLKMAKAEPAFLHISEKAQESESKWNRLYTKEAKITGSADLPVGDYIAKNLKQEVASQYLLQQLEVLDKLKDLPTARLERAFAEHIDCCTYRLDAWKAGIMNYQLSMMRQNLSDNGGEFRQGLHIGAFGWLENVKSENKVLSPVQLPDEKLNDYFNKNTTLPPLQSDNTNGGFILAPSLDHAVTASILRNGYTANKNPEALRINLSSERVRKALSMIEGIRGGQSMGALLGYQLERGLHEGYPGVELDFLIYQLRKAFPLVVNRIKGTKLDDPTDPSEATEIIEARNVIDGLSLINQITKSGQATYPFGKTNLPTSISPAQAAAINSEIAKIRDINDAVADLAMAESVHQVVQGNYDRANATLDAFSKGNFPPEPDVIKTPRSGSTLTHRVGLHLKPGLPLDPTATPRVQAEPAINDWLQMILPPFADIVCTASYGAVTDEPITAAALGLSPIDLLYTINTENEQALAEIDDRIIKIVLDKPGVRPDTDVRINYVTRQAGKYSFFETAPLLNSLRAILLRSRPLAPNDIAIAADAKSEEDSAVFADNNFSRLQAVHTALQTFRNTALNNYINTLTPLMADTVAARDAILTGLDANFISPLLSLLTDYSKTGLPQSGFGFIYTRKKELYKSLLKKADDLVGRWDDRLVKFDSAMLEFDAMPGTTPVEEQIAFLQKTELLISTVVRTVLPALPLDYKNLLLADRTTFKNKRDDFAAIATTNLTSLKDLLDLLKAQLPIDTFDAEPFELKAEEDALIIFADELFTKATLIAADLDKRLQSATDLFAEYTTATDNNKKVNIVNEAVKQLLHEDFKIIPEFAVPPTTADEWNNSYAAKTQLLSHLQTTLGVDFPEDDWLYGAARVREKMHHWENLVLLSPAFQKTAPELHPVQLPYKAADSWLALDYPETYTIDSDRLLYTAHYTTAFDKNINQCGLLIDEWTEVVPSKEETVGLSFHYDRPNAEPPQAMLLAMPTAFTGAWRWEDLLDTVNETLDMAKKRAIEPGQVDTTDYGRFLPALISSMTVHPLTVSLNLSFNNRIHEVLNS